MAVCSMCMKSADIGNLVSHAKNRVKTVRRPNLHTKTVLVGRTKKKVKMCSSCLRTIKRVARVDQDVQSE